MRRQACVGCGRPTPGARCSRCKLRPRARGNAFEPVRQAVLERDEHRCQLQLEGCTVVADHVDHITPRADGGSDDPSNLRAACSHCNLRRGTGLRALA